MVRRLGLRLSVDQPHHGPPHFLEKLRKRECQDKGAADEDHVNAFREPFLEAPIGLPKSSARPVPIDCAANPPAHRESSSVLSCSTTKPEQNKAPPFVSVSSLEDRLDLGGSPKPRAPGRGEGAPDTPSCAPA